MGAGEAELIAQELHQQRARLDLGADALAVDGESDVHLHGRDPS
jgi:hypothetical protein